METGAAFGEPEDTSKRARGFELLLQLTDALCELYCLQDAQGRVQFASLLGEHLDRQIDVRGVRLREDVMALVRAALNVPGGERLLVFVVRILEGDSAGDELDRLVDPAAPQAGPLSRHDERTARAVLVLGELDAIRLRDELVEELNGVDVPVGLTPEQLFSHVLELNAQQDGLPPVLLLLDLAARLAMTHVHRTTLADWVDDWIRRAGLREQLEERRRVRVLSAPCCWVQLMLVDDDPRVGAPIPLAVQLVAESAHPWARPGVRPSLHIVAVPLSSAEVVPATVLYGPGNAESVQFSVTAAEPGTHRIRFTFLHHDTGVALQQVETDLYIAAATNVEIRRLAPHGGRS